MASHSSQPGGTYPVGSRLYSLRYFPTRAVSYPAPCSHVATVERSRKEVAPPCGVVFWYTPVCREYCPVRMVARDGQHSDVVTNELAKVTPCPPRSFRTSGITPKLSHRWSSERIRTMFGRGLRRVPSTSSLQASTPATSAATRASASILERRAAATSDRGEAFGGHAPVRPPLVDVEPVRVDEVEGHRKARIAAVSDAVPGHQRHALPRWQTSRRPAERVVVGSHDHVVPLPALGEEPFDLLDLPRGCHRGVEPDDDGRVLERVDGLIDGGRGGVHAGGERHRRVRAGGWWMVGIRRKRRHGLHLAGADVCPVEPLRVGRDVLHRAASGRRGCGRGPGQQGPLLSVQPVQEHIERAERHHGEHQPDGDQSSAN